MPESTERAIRIWAAPVLLTALLTVCGYLWLDQARRMDRMTDEIGDLRQAVTRLTVLTEK
jgi:hypothetical protein